MNEAVNLISFQFFFSLFPTINLDVSSVIPDLQLNVLVGCPYRSTVASGYSAGEYTSTVSWLYLVVNFMIKQLFKLPADHINSIIIT